MIHPTAKLLCKSILIQIKSCLPTEWKSLWMKEDLKRVVQSVYNAWGVVGDQ